MDLHVLRDTLSLPVPGQKLRRTTGRKTGPSQGRRVATKKTTAQTAAPTGVVAADGDDDTNAKNQALYLTPANLTFPGVTVAAGFILNFIDSQTAIPRLWVALAVALVFGSFITWLGLTDSKGVKDRATGLFVGIVNTALMWIAIYGVSSIPT